MAAFVAVMAVFAVVDIVFRGVLIFVGHFVVGHLVIGEFVIAVVIVVHGRTILHKNGTGAISCSLLVWVNASEIYREMKSIFLMEMSHTTSEQITNKRRQTHEQNLGM